MLFASIECINKDKNCLYGEHKEPVENKSVFYKECVHNYGRCVSKVYVDKPTPIPVGWVFLKRMTYSDSKKTYLQETWVTLYEEMRTYHRLSK